jgi:hypothetical protein
LQETAMPIPYPPVVEQAMLITYASLNERQRRLFAAAEAIKLGHGGIAYVARLFDCHRKTIQRGLAALQSEETPLPPDQARKKGADANAVCPSGLASMRRS